MEDTETLPLATLAYHGPNTSSNLHSSWGVENTGK